MMNYHTHCHYCDGKYAPEAYVLEAIEQEFAALGFSSHAPLPFDNEWSMRGDQVENYLNDIRLLRLKYDTQLQISCGMEVDFIPNRITPKSDFIQNLDLDYIIGSIHFVDAFEDGRPWEIDGTHRIFKDGLHQIFEGNIQQVIKRYFELTRQMLADAKPDVLGHLDKIKIQNPCSKFYQESSFFYKREVFRTLEAIADSEVIVEINTRGVYKKLHVEPYPSHWILKRMHYMNIPIMLNSDAHHPREIMEGFAPMCEMLYTLGFRELYAFLDHEWQPLPLTTQGVLVPEYA